MRARRGSAALLASALAASTVAVGASRVAAAAPAPCDVDVRVEPGTPFVGEQVLYRVRILRRPDVERVAFATPLAFPDVRAEWLPGRAEESAVRREGATFLVREEHRALFVEHPGHHTLPAFALSCTLADGSAHAVAVPAVALEVSEPPRAGRPPRWRGAVGPLYVGRTADAREIALGESVRVSVTLRGGGNLWAVDDPFGGDPPPDGAEVFRRPPELDTEAGERLFVRRFFRADVVPHVEGRLVLPAIEVPYWDPRARRYAIARAEPLEIRVGPRRASAPDAARARGDGPSANGDAPRGSLALPVAAVGVAAGAAGIGALALAAWRARRRRGPVERALGTARRARDDADFAGEAAALARALAAAADDGEPSDELSRRVRAASEALDRVRFSDAAGRADAASIEALIAALARGSAGVDER